MLTWILENIVIYIPNLLLKVFNFELVKTGKIEFDYKDALYYPTPRETPSVIVDLVINNLSTDKDKLTDISLEVNGNKYRADYCNPIPRKEHREFIKLPFQVAPRGEGYYNMPLYFNVVGSKLEIRSFGDNQHNPIAVPAKLIIKRAAALKKDVFLDININLAPGESWPREQGVHRSENDLRPQHL